MYYRINMQTIFLKIFVCKLVEYHLSAILTNFCQSRRRFPYSGPCISAFPGRVFPLSVVGKVPAVIVSGNIHCPFRGDGKFDAGIDGSCRVIEDICL